MTPRTPVVRSAEDAVWKIELDSEAAPRRPSGQSRTRPSTEYVTRWSESVKRTPVATCEAGNSVSIRPTGS